MTGQAARINGKLVWLQLQLLCLQRGETHISTQSYIIPREERPLRSCAEGRTRTSLLLPDVVGKPGLCWTSCLCTGTSLLRRREAGIRFVPAPIEDTKAAIMRLDSSFSPTNAHILSGAGRLHGTRCLNRGWVVTTNSRTRPCARGSDVQRKTGRTQIDKSRGVQPRRRRAP